MHCLLLAAAASIQAPVAASPNPDAAAPAGLQLFGDFRLRVEQNAEDEDGATTQRMQLRTRLGGSYEFSPGLKTGTRVVLVQSSPLRGFGDTFSNLADTHETVLDHAYIEYEAGDWTLTAGRFVNPFFRADSQLVWDADFSPQGVAAAVNLDAGEDSPVARLSAAHFALAPGGVGRGSQVSGVQLFVSPRGDQPRVRLAMGYYDYDLRGRPDLDSGRYRGNLLDSNGAYLSDFDLMNITGVLSLRPFGARWPLEIFVDYVKNLGARTDSNSAYALDVSIGSLDRRGDIRLNYALARAGVDAVLAPISQDNTKLGSNYVQHTIGVEYVPHAGAVLSATWYHYRPNESRHAGPNAPDNWLDRLRLNFNQSF